MKHFENFIDWIDQKIRKHTGGLFKIRIEVNKESQPIQNFPTYPNIPDFVDIWEYDRHVKDERRANYTTWIIDFKYFWQHDEKQGNRFFADQLFKALKKLSIEYWNDCHYTMGIKGSKDVRCRKNEGNYLVLHVEPTPLYVLFDEHLEREVNAPARKEWYGDITIDEMKQISEDIADMDFTDQLISFFKT